MFFSFAYYILSINLFSPSGHPTRFIKMVHQVLLRVLCLFSIFSLLHIKPSQTIEVTPNSQCSSLCMDKATNNPADDISSLTLSSDVVCSDADFVGSEISPKGRKWNDCLSCEQMSNATDTKTKQNDLYWLLCTFAAFFYRLLHPVFSSGFLCLSLMMKWSSIVNMKFVIDWCVFAYPDNAQPPPVQGTCSDVCAGPDNSVKISLNNRIYEANATLQYLYCDGPNILANFDDCIDCLNKAPDAQILAQCNVERIEWF